MAKCVVNDHNDDSFHLYMPCMNEAEPGRKRCAYHLRRQRERQAKYAAKRRKVAESPRPAWMDDPNLLPKRPPGQ